MFIDRPTANFLVYSPLRCYDYSIGPVIYEGDTLLPEKPSQISKDGKFAKVPSIKGGSHGTGNETFEFVAQFKRLASIVGDFIFQANRKVHPQTAVSYGVPTWYDGNPRRTSTLALILFEARWWLIGAEVIVSPSAGAYVTMAPVDYFQVNMPAIIKVFFTIHIITLEAARSGTTDLASCGKSQ
ncbi:hypothetical protein B0J17DRAFT_722186 [Rhizoctonia solani]|nr:hypothetical protein B0J17DRAFT_722186 [Rhizoctonia solani]